MACVVSGLLNKQVGAELGISEITVKAHRGKVMRKMEADSLADLVTRRARPGGERGLDQDLSRQRRRPRAPRGAAGTDGGAVRQRSAQPGDPALPPGGLRQ